MHSHTHTHTHVGHISQPTSSNVSELTSARHPPAGELGLLLELWEGHFAPDLRDRSLLDALTPQTDGYSSSVLTDLNFEIDAKKGFVAKLRGGLRHEFSVVLVRSSI